MNGINLHAVVRSAITAVNPDEQVTLYQSAGQRHLGGIVTPLFFSPATVMVQFQPNEANRLRQLEAMSVTEHTEQIFLYSDNNRPIEGIARVPILRTGDYIERRQGEYWKVTAVIEDWSGVGWTNCEVALQVAPIPDFQQHPDDEDAAARSFMKGER